MRLPRLGSIFHLPGLRSIDSSPPLGNPGPWRAYLDLEHSNVYNETVHWNALTDGVMKYVFNAFYPSEMLFNLSADPGACCRAVPLAVWTHLPTYRRDGQSCT